MLSFTDSNAGLSSLPLSLGDTYFAPANNEGFEFTISGDITAITVEV